MTALAQASLTPPHSQLVYWPIAPELVLVGVGLFLLLLDALYPRRHHATLALMSLAAILGAAATSLYLWFWNGAASGRTFLGGMVAADKFTVFLRLVILSAAFVATLLGYQYLERADEVRGEYYPLLLFATSGMTLITAAS